MIEGIIIGYFIGLITGVFVAAFMIGAKHNDY